MIFRVSPFASRADGCLRLPEIFFACLQLRHLHLRYCLFDPLPTFEGFDYLISIEFQNVAFTRNISFISKCPLLERLTLKGCTNNGNLDIDAPKLKLLYIHGSWNTICFRKTPLLASVTVRGELKYTETPGIIGVFRSLPVIESLAVEYHFWQILAAGNVPDRLPANLKYLRTL